MESGYRKSRSAVGRNRDRCKPNRRWTTSETRMLINFMSNEPAFEYPTSRVYYEKFTAQYNLDCEWKHCKNRVRHMRDMCEKANAWRKSPESAHLPPNETVESMLNKICPHYHKLHEVFLKKKLKDASDELSDDAPKLCDPETLEYAGSNDPLSNTRLEVEINHFSQDEDNDERETPIPQLSAPKRQEKLFNNNKFAGSKKNKQHSTTGNEDIRLEIEIERHNFKKALLDLEERKFKFERERTRRELEFKEKRWEQKQHLRTLAMESRERIAMKELELKYRYAASDNANSNNVLF